VRGRIEIDAKLVQELVASQFRQWAQLPVRSVEVAGWDNASFRLGGDMVVRLPRASDYAEQPLKEHRWLPVLAPQLPLEIPKLLSLGNPSADYPWHWSIRRWVDGEPALPDRIPDLSGFARALAGFLKALQAIPAGDGPAAGPQSFHRGGSLSVYDSEVRAAVDRLGTRMDGAHALRIWDEARATTWSGRPVWIHGDISVGNLLVRHGELAAVIDFGQLAIGDPACDLAIAWSFFAGASREAFRSALALDPGTWNRGRAWALWKALITVSGLAQTSAFETAQAERTLGAVLTDSA
jgi:aminoglycoside phosphotransferase (APT) family kinase protein